MDLDPSVLWDFAGEVVGSVRPSARRVPATVTRVDADGTVWVTTGDGTEAPAATCGAGVSVGDVVSVEWSGAQMGVTGNVSDPSAGSRAVGAVQRAVRAARSVADGAQAIANAIGQHFWADDNGAHVSTEAGNAIGARNILMNSLGILLRQEGTWLASFSDSAVAFFDGLGNTAANVVATFGLDGARIGRESESHMLLDYHSMQMVDKEGSTYFHVSDLRGPDGTLAATDTFVGDGSTKRFDLMYQAASTDYTVTVSDGSGGTISKQLLWVTFSNPPTNGATITVEYTTTVSWAKAYTLGTRGAGNVGAMSVASGYECVASNEYAHAEGFSATASGSISHAEGGYTVASGSYSHAQNNNTVARGNSQTAIGRYNANDPNNAFEIGNGASSSARSNAFAVDWSGNVTAAGDVTATGDVTSSGNLTAANFCDAAMTRDLGSSGTVRACRIGSMVVMSGVLGGCTVSDTYTWTHLAHIDPADLGITSVTSMGATVEVSGGGPSYAGTTNAGGTARIVDGVLYAEMQTSAAFSAKYVKFVITAYVE